jgi:Ca2+-binding EF-hand superfamily protein
LVNILPIDIFYFNQSINYILFRDGFIDKEDLHDMLASLGKDPTDEYLEDMMNEAPGNSFRIFLVFFSRIYFCWEDS